MRLANRNRLQLSMAAILATVALILMARWIASSDVPSPNTTSVTHYETGQNDRPLTQKESALSVLRNDQLKLREGIEYKGTGRNIFRLGIRVSQRPPRPQPDPPTQEKSLPSAATVRLKFFGFAITQVGEQVFLSEDGDVFIGREGDIVNHRYKILRVGPASVEVEDLMNEVRQIVALEQG